MPRVSSTPGNVEEVTIPGGYTASTRYLLYLPRLLVVAPESLRTERVAQLDGTVVFADVSGFTALSEELAKEGKVGAERITEIINEAFNELLTISRLEGGDLISFGGDAALLLFTGPEHARRAATAAFEMREALNEFAAAEAPGPLSISQGVASGQITAVMAGSYFRQLVLVGQVVDQMIDLESAAGSNEILLSSVVAGDLGLVANGHDRAPGVLLEEAPQPSDFEPSDDEFENLIDLSAFIPGEIRDELLLSRAQGEHRPAVVGFIRAVGIGKLLEEGGADAARDGLDRLVDSVAEASTDHRVTFLSSDVSRDGVKLVLTAGVPRAIQDPEERMLRTLRRVIETPVPLELHVGVAAGHVFSGDLGAAFRRGYTVMGDTVNLAARLAGEAETGQILTTRRVFERCRTSFELKELPSVELKGKAVPLKPLEVGPILSTPTAKPILTGPLFGRSEELALLREALDALEGGRGRVIEIHGDVGIGKSRLLAELPELVPRHETTIFECEEYESATPYWAAGLLLRHLTDLKRVESASETGQQLKGLLNDRAPDLLPWLPLLAMPFGAIVDMTEEVEALGEEFRLPKLFEVVGDLLEPLMPEPRIIAFDNAQWMDPASSELLQAVILTHAAKPWVWVWADRHDESAMSYEVGATNLTLGPLPDEEARLLVQSMNPETPPIRTDEIVSRAGGNPLFLSELATAPSEVGVPDSVERLFAARIDALGPLERRLLREASVLGQQFDLELLAESLGSETPGVDDPDVWEHLREFLHFGGTGRVRFVQPLVRDVAYEGLPFRRRRQLHNLVGETIERRARHRANRQAAVLSLHFFNAQRFDKAWEYASAGAERAAERYANREAVTLYQRALDAAEQDDSVSDDEKAFVAERLGDAAELAADYGRAREAYELAEKLDGEARIVELARKKALLHEKAGEYDDAIQLLETALSHRTLTGDSRVRAMAAMAGVRYRQGDYKSSAKWSRRALELETDTGSPTEAHARYLLSLNQTHFGDPERVENAQVALQIYEGLGDWVGAGKVLNNLGIDAYYDGRWVEAIDLYSRSRKASEKAGDVHMMAMQDNNLAEIYSDQGHLDNAEELFRRTESIWRPARFEAGIALVTSNMGRLEVRRGQWEEGIHLLQEALRRFSEIGAEAYVAETRMRLVEAELYGDADAALESLAQLVSDLGEAGAARTLGAGLFRLRGHALALLGDVDGAREAFESALETAANEDARYEVGLASRALGILGDETRGAEGKKVLEELGAAEGVIPPLP
ncbi:MAG: tetratricopeptide repeat protein [Acidimicrobiia bacterium]